MVTTTKNDATTLNLTRPVEKTIPQTTPSREKVFEGKGNYRCPTVSGEGTR